MFCKNCGNELKGIEMFCPTCGTPVQVEEKEKAISLTETTAVEESTNFGTSVRRDVYSIVTPALVMDEVEKADATVVEYTPYETDIYECQKKLASVKSLGTWMRVGIVVLSFFMLNAGEVGAMLFIVGLIAAVFAPIAYKRSASEPLNEKIAADNAAIAEIIGRTETCIPARFIYANAVNYIRELIAAGRAKTLADAIDRLEEQEHRWEVEAQNNQMILEQKEQSARLRSIEVASWGNFWRR